MTPKEKAEKLIEKFTFICKECDYKWNAKQCALIAVDEILVLICCMDGKEHWQEYYEQVKQEIEKI